MSGDPMRLPEDVLWQGDGHLSSTALSVVADGETSLLSPRALDHLESCEDCTTRLGEGALLSVSTGKALAAVARQALAEQAQAQSPAATPKAPSAAPRRRPIPFLAIAAALLVAALAALPKLASAPDEAAATLRIAQRGLPAAAKSAVALGREAEPWLALSWVPWAAAALLVIAGVVIARASTDRIEPTE